MKTLSYVIDLLVFFILLYGFEVNWLVALVFSEIVGAGIRAAFVHESQPTQTETE